MNIRGVFLILLFASATPILFSIMIEDTEVPVIPEDKETIIINLSQPNLEFTVNTAAVIKLNVSYFHADTNSSDVILENIEFSEYYILEGLSSGLYAIEIISSQLADITIKNTGLRIPSLVIFVILTIINIYNLYQLLEEQ